MRERAGGRRGDHVWWSTFTCGSPDERIVGGRCVVVVDGGGGMDADVDAGADADAEVEADAGADAGACGGERPVCDEATART